MAILRQQALAELLFAALERGARRSGDARLPLPRMPLDPILGQTLGLNDLRSCHVPSDLFHIVVSWGVKRGADDCEPHVCLHFVL
jgi:hypothetical protein